MTGLTSDTGALISIERGDARICAPLSRASDSGLEISVPPGVVAQAWRGGPRQARVAMLLITSRHRIQVTCGVSTQLSR